PARGFGAAHDPIPHRPPAGGDALAPAGDDAPGARAVGDGVDGLGHVLPGVLDLGSHFTCALAHWASSFNVSTVSSGTGRTSRSRPRPFIRTTTPIPPVRPGPPPRGSRRGPAPSRSGPAR